MYHLYSVEKEALKASSEVLLVAKEDLVEVAHPSDEHPVVDVQLVEPARKFGSAVTVLLFYCSKKDIFFDVSLLLILQISSFAAGSNQRRLFDLSPQRRFRQNLQRTAVMRHRI